MFIPLHTVGISLCCIYIIHGKCLGQVFPFVYGLMENKRISYKQLFSSIAQISLENCLFCHKVAMMDFESLAMMAIKEISPTTQPKGFSFHYMQCIMRKVSLCCLYTIHKKYLGQVFPFVYCLMENKKMTNIYFQV